MIIYTFSYLYIIINSIFEKFKFFTAELLNYDQIVNIK